MHSIAYLSLCILHNDMQRQFAQTSTNVSQRGEFFKNFKIWLTESCSEGGDEDGTENTSQAETEDSMQPGSQSSLGHSIVPAAVILIMTMGMDLHEDHASKTIKVKLNS